MGNKHSVNKPSKTAIDFNENIANMASKKQSFKRNRSQKAELLVFGFVKEIVEESYPKELLQLFFLWYFINEQWDKVIKGKDIEIIDDLSIVHTDYDKGCWQGALGTIECSLSKCYWKLKITEEKECIPSNTIRIMVGICEEKCWEKMVNNHTGPYQHMYCFWASSSISLWQSSTRVTEKYGEPFEKEGDTIELYLNMDDKTLSYTINGNDYGVAFKDIEQGNYRVAVSVCVNRTLTLIQ